MQNGRELSLFVFVDAYGWELVRRYPILSAVLTVRRPLETVFGYSSTCVPTILTGRLPREHGHFTFYYYNPAGSPFGLYRVLELLPRAVTGRGRVRHALSRAAQRLHGYTGYFELYNMPFWYLSLFDYAEKRDLYQPGGINGGLPTIFDYLRETGVPFVMPDWRLPDADRAAAVCRAVESGQPRFGWLYLGALDGILHTDGAAAPGVARCLEQYETWLNRIIAAAQARYGALRLFVFSDHGMTETVDTCDLMRRADTAGLRFGADYVAAYDSTMARFWFPNPAARAPVEDVLRQETRGAILDDTTLAGWGCDFPQRKYGELFFLMNPGVLLCPSFMGARPLAGMHGYEPGHKDSVAAFTANVDLEHYPQRLDGLYALMRAEAERSRESALP